MLSDSRCQVQSDIIIVICSFARKRTPCPSIEDETESRSLWQSFERLVSYMHETVPRQDWNVRRYLVNTVTKPWIRSIHCPRKACANGRNCSRFSLPFVCVRGSIDGLKRTKDVQSGKSLGSPSIRLNAFGNSTRREESFDSSISIQIPPCLS